MNAKNCLCTYLNFNSFRLTEQDLATVGGGRTNLAANYVFRLKHNNIGKYMSVVAIYGIDIMHYSNDDKISAFNAFGSATQLLDLPHKYIFSHKNLTFQGNVSSWNTKNANTAPIYKGNAR